MLTIPLMRDILHDGIGLSQLDIAIDKVWQIGELKTEGVLLAEPLLSGEVRSVTLLIMHLIEIDTKIFELVTDLLGKSTDLPVAKDWFAGSGS